MMLSRPAWHTPAWLLLGAAAGAEGAARPLKLAGILRPDVDGADAGPGLTVPADMEAGGVTSSRGASGAGAALMRENRPSSSIIFTPFSFAWNTAMVCSTEHRRQS